MQHLFFLTAASGHWLSKWLPIGRYHHQRTLCVINQWAEYLLATTPYSLIGTEVYVSHSDSGRQNGPNAPGGDHIHTNTYKHTHTVALAITDEQVPWCFAPQKIKEPSSFEIVFYSARYGFNFCSVNIYILIFHLFRSTMKKRLLQIWLFRKL